MNHERDMDLVRLFAEQGEPAEGEVFTEQVTSRIKFLRRSRGVRKILMAIAGMIMLTILTPSLIDLTGYIVFGSNLLTVIMLTIVLSPVGWTLGGGFGIFFFLRMRA
jgi:hypothetical protein